MIICDHHDVASGAHDVRHDAEDGVPAHGVLARGASAHDVPEDDVSCGVDHHGAAQTH
jgi:hypothetical protein